MNIYGEPLDSTASPFDQRRRSGIGGSDAAAILGVSPWASALSVWSDKRGLSASTEPSERMLWGTRLEDAVRAGYAEDTGRKVQRVGFRRHKDIPWLIGHPDGDAGDRLLEIKVTGQTWDEVPAHYYAQVQHYMMLVGKPLCDLAALVNGRELRIDTIEADPEFQGAMVEELASFWEQVRSGIPPLPDGSESARQALRKVYPDTLEDVKEATPQIEALMADYAAAKAIARAAEMDAEDAAQTIQAYLGGVGKLVGAEYDATWSEAQGSISWKGVAQDYRAVLESIRYNGIDGIEEAHRGEPSRRFAVKARKEGTA